MWELLQTLWTSLEFWHLCEAFPLTVSCLNVFPAFDLKLETCSPWVQSESIKSIAQPVPFNESQCPSPVWRLMTYDGVNHTRRIVNHPDVHNFWGILSKSASHYRIVDKDEVSKTPWPNWNWKPLKHGREIHSCGETDRLSLCFLHSEVVAWDTRKWNN